MVAGEPVIREGRVEETRGGRGGEVAGAANRRWWNRGEAHEGGGEDDRERGRALPEVAAGRVLTSTSQIGSKQ